MPGHRAALGAGRRDPSTLQVIVNACVKQGQWMPLNVAVARAKGDHGITCSAEETRWKETPSLSSCPAPSPGLRKGFLEKVSATWRVPAAYQRDEQVVKSRSYLGISGNPSPKKGKLHAK